MRRSSSIFSPTRRLTFTLDISKVRGQWVNLVERLIEEGRLWRFVVVLGRLMPLFNLHCMPLAVCLFLGSKTKSFHSLLCTSTDHTTLACTLPVKEKLWRPPAFIWQIVSRHQRQNNREKIREDAAEVFNAVRVPGLFGNIDNFSKNLSRVQILIQIFGTDFQNVSTWHTWGAVRRVRCI